MSLIALVVMLVRSILRPDPYRGRPFDPRHDDSIERFEVRVAAATKELRENVTVIGIAFLLDWIVWWLIR